MSAMSELITSLRDSLAAADETVMTTAQLRSAILRAVMLVNRDFETVYTVIGDEFDPLLSTADREMLLIAASISCCAIEIARAARHPSFKAGNISIDRSRSVGAWRELLQSLSGQYERLAAMSQDDRAASVKPLLFERGVSVLDPPEIFE